MSTFEAVEQRLRDACPAPQSSPPPLFRVIERIQRDGAQAPMRGGTPRRWWRRGRIVAPLLASAVVLAGAGGGALLLLPGKTLAPEYVLPANPQTGLGQPVPASLALLPIRAADPRGGPPWGMRVIRTTRGLVCLQGGRVLGGQLGGLGTGYAFSGDGRFHPFSPEVAVGTDACLAAGSASAFMPGPPVIVPANALALAGENLAPANRVHCDLPGQEDWGIRCPNSELRQVAMGLLGPDASSIEVAAAGQRFNVDPYGPEGAYLIVLPAQPDANANMSSGAYGGPYGYTSHAPGGALLTVTYRDGSRCVIPPANAQQQCHAQGAGSESAPLPRAAGSAVSATYVPLDTHPVAPLLATERSSSTTAQRAFQTAPGSENQPGPAVKLTFKAPLAAANASTAYVAELHPREVAGCATPSVIVSQPSSETISAGRQVEMTVPLEDRCATSYSGRVFLARSSSIGGESGGAGPLYEVIAAQFGLSPGSNPMKFPTVGTFEISTP